jgi:hypothetical protein
LPEESKIRISPFRSVKIAVFAPMPSAKVSRVIVVNPGLWARLRAPYRRSRLHEGSAVLIPADMNLLHVLRWARVLETAPYHNALMRHMSLRLVNFITRGNQTIAIFRER